MLLAAGIAGLVIGIGIGVLFGVLLGSRRGQVAEELRVTDFGGLDRH